MAQEIADSKLIDTWGSGGAKIEPDISKIIEGWQLGEQPPHEYMNWLQNTFGSKLNHILKNGVPLWNNATQYLAGSTVQHSGSIWICKTTNTNSEPTDENANWEKIPSLENLALTVDTINDFPTSATTGDTCIVKDLDRGGIFIYDSTKVAESNNGTNFNGWVRQFSGTLNAKWFGLSTVEELRLHLSSFPTLLPSCEYGGVKRINNPQDTTSVVDFAHFAGQSTGSLTPIAVVVHNYTDAPLAQFDNVGSGEILKLVNASNPGRRPDKPNDYVGTGAFLRLEESGKGRLFFISREAKFVWNGRGGEFIADVTPGGGFPFTLEAYGDHTLMLQYKNNNNRVFNIQKQGNEIVLESETTSGISLSSNNSTVARVRTKEGGALVLNNGTNSMIQATNGNLKLLAGSGGYIDNLNPVGLRKYPSIAEAPVMPSNAVCLAWSITEGRVITWNGTAWI